MRIHKAIQVKIHPAQDHATPCGCPAGHLFRVVRVAQARVARASGGLSA